MLGNDIVDLTDPETRRGNQHPRFDQRVFTPRERASLARSPDPTRTRWILWSVKESAYKALRRVLPETVFSPVEFAVELDSQQQGFVTYRQHRFHARVEIDAGCIHAIVSDHTRRSTLWGSKQIVISAPLQPGRIARALALDRIAARFRIARSDLSIDRDGRIPQLLHHGEPTRATLSLSHHGSYVGFACQLTDWSEEATH